MGKFNWAKPSQFFREAEDFSYKSFALTYRIAKVLLQKSIYCRYRESLAQQKFPCLQYTVCTHQQW